MCQDAFGNPVPHQPGQVVEAPVWIRVKSDWYEKFLLLFIVILCMLIVALMRYGSAPSRQSEQTGRINRVMLCDLANERDAGLYRKYEGLGYCP